MPEEISKSVSGPGATYPGKSPTPETAQYVLPKNIANSVRHLSDGDLDLLFHACATEKKRRGAKRARPIAEAAPRHVDPTIVSMTTAQVGAVQAAFKAGVKPVAIARQFRLSHAQVREALSLKAR